MINSICVDSGIQEDPGDLLVAMQSCVMKAVHHLLPGTSEEMRVSQGCCSEAVVVTDYPEISLLPPCKSPMPLRGQIHRDLSPQPKQSQGSFSHLFVQSHMYFPLPSLHR